MGLHPGQDLHSHKGFSHIVHSTGGKALNLVSGVVQSTDKQYRNILERGNVLHGAAHRKAVHAGHQYIEQD